jgi:two-component system sensor histidine kinase KdpD
MIRTLFRLGSKLRRINPYFASIASIGVAVLIVWNLPEETALSSAGVILLMSVLASAACWGLGPGLAAGVCAGLALDYYFIPPIYSFSIDDWRHAFSWFIFELSSVAVCFVADKLRQRTQVARRAELLANRLRVMSQRLLEAGDICTIARMTVSAMGAALGARVILFIPRGDTFETVTYPTGTLLSREELGAAMRQYNICCDEREKTSDKDELLCRTLPIKAVSEKAVVVVGPTRRRRPGLQGRARAADLFAAQAAAAFERLALAKEIEDARIAAETEKMRSALLTSISHDLKAPLSAILGSASILQALGSNISHQPGSDLLDTIQTEGRRLEQFIANLLDMSRVESDAVRPKIEPADLDDLVGSALERASHFVAHHSVAADLPPGLPFLELDPVIAERVLFNVLENAARYTPEGTQITLSAALQGAFVDLRIMDEGDGIPEKDLPYLFDKFYRVETRRERPSGTGLGLAICRGFLQAMGGSISASNRRDRKGAIFTIRFPVWSKQPRITALGAPLQIQPSLDA